MKCAEKRGRGFVPAAAPIITRSSKRRIPGESEDFEWLKACQEFRAIYRELRFHFTELLKTDCMPLKGQLLKSRVIMPRLAHFQVLLCWETHKCLLKSAGDNQLLSVLETSVEIRYNGFRNTCCPPGARRRGGGSRDKMLSE
jgi:hypothetical protein